MQRERRRIMVIAGDANLESDALAEGELRWSLTSRRRTKTSGQDVSIFAPFVQLLCRLFCGHWLEVTVDFQALRVLLVMETVLPTFDCISSLLDFAPFGIQIHLGHFVIYRL